MTFKKIFFIFLFISFLIITPIFAQNDNQVSDLQKKINEYQQKLIELRQQKNTLSSQIQYMDTQIYLTTLKIQETEEKIKNTEKEINILESKIGNLDESLNKISKLLINKIVENYKQQKISLISFLLNSHSANDFFLKLKYIKTARNNNQKLLIQVQEAKLNFEEQKKLREEKITELENLKKTLNYQQADLNNQKLAKKQLLEETQNDEQIYQSLLAKAQAEYQAIQGIIAGGGTEKKIREVKKGDIIGMIIPGPSCNSSGSHLHFIIQENGQVKNPFNYLKPIDYRDYSGGDYWNPSGNLDWPISAPIEFHQGFGETWAIKNTWVGNIYKFHNGIDISNSSDYNIYAISDGDLYRGSYNVGCVLSYIKLVHKDSNISTLYLHSYSQ